MQIKPAGAFISAFLCAAIISGCATDLASPSSENEIKPVQFEKNGYYLALPKDYLDSVVINPEDDNEESPEYTLFNVYYKPSYDAAKAEGYTGGKLFSIWQLNRAQYERYLSEGDWINEYAFACDESFYYIIEEPVDIQIWSPEEWKPYSEALEACCPAAIEAFKRLNNLKEYSDDTFWNSTETYGGEHKYFRYYPYRAYPEVETTENKEMYETIMLSQPVKQGSGGIWCVERVYDAAEYGYIYPVFPCETNRSAMEVYTELQVSADKGNSQELLDPLSVALEYVQTRKGHTKATEDSFEEVQGPPDGHYSF